MTGGLILNALNSGGANLGTKTITANGTYTAQTDGYDGYSSVTVAVPLTGRTFTANGSYTADTGGWNSVIVDVPTYEEEYEEMLECCEEVKEKLKELDPDYNPDDPDAPTIPEEIDKVSGYTFPDGTDIRQITPVIGDEDRIVPEGNTYSFRFYVLDGYTSTEYPVNHLFQPSATGQSYALRGRYAVIDSSGEVVTDYYTTSLWEISPQRDVTWQITDVNINYTTQRLETTLHIIENGYEQTETFYNDIHEYLDTTVTNPRYKVYN